MAPKGGNAKKESGRAKKAENEQKKKDAAALDKERKEAGKWQDGSKDGNSKQEKEEKRRQELARKAENARLLAEEEAAQPPKVKTVPKAGAKKAAVKDPRPAGPGAIAAGGGLDPVDTDKAPPQADLVEAFAASNIDDALDLMETINAKHDKASVGAQAASIERHPEAALEAYQERELPNLKVDHPGLRLQQYKDLLFKQFQKSPDNPFNQTTTAYDATKEEKVQALEHQKRAVEERLRDNTSS